MFRFLAVPALLLAALGCGGAAPAGPAAGPTPASPPGPAEVRASGDVPPTGTGVGQRIPDFAINLADGTTVTRGHLLEDQRPAFLFFFATW